MLTVFPQDVNRPQGYGQVDDNAWILSKIVLIIIHLLAYEALSMLETLHVLSANKSQNKFLCECRSDHVSTWICKNCGTGWKAHQVQPPAGVNFHDPCIALSPFHEVWQYWHHLTMTMLSFFQKEAKVMPIIPVAEYFNAFFLDVQLWWKQRLIELLHFIRSVELCTEKLKRLSLISLLW